MTMLKGEFSQRGVILYIASTFAIIATCFAASWLAYPEEERFSILTHSISYLGDWEQNPDGWWLLSLGVAVNALSFVPLILHVRSSLDGIDSRDGNLGTLFMFVGVVGGLLVALIPDIPTWKAVHANAGNVAFVGTTLGLLAYGGAFHRNPWPGLLGRNFAGDTGRSWAAIAFRLFMASVVLTLGFNLAGVMQGFSWPYPGIYSFSLWEWIVYWLSFVAFYAVVISLSRQVCSGSPCAEGTSIETGRRS